MQQSADLAGEYQDRSAAQPNVIVDNSERDERPNMQQASYQCRQPAESTRAANRHDHFHETSLATGEHDVRLYDGAALPATRSATPTYKTGRKASSSSGWDKFGSTSPASGEWPASSSVRSPKTDGGSSNRRANRRLDHRSQPFEADDLPGQPAVPVAD